MSYVSFIFCVYCGKGNLFKISNKKVRLGRVWFGWDFSYLGRTEKDTLINVICSHIQNREKLTNENETIIPSPSELKTEWIISKYSNQVVV